MTATTIKFICLIIFAYFLGNLSPARIIAALSKKDIVKAGSGNPGSMNMLRTHGFLMGVTTLFLDAIKGAIPAIVGFYLLGANAFNNLGTLALYVGGLACVMGHIYPAIYNFRGGKGIASSIGVFFVADPIICLIIFFVLLVFFYFVKIGSLTSLLYITIFALYQSFFSSVNKDWTILLMIWLIVFIDLYAHRENLIRLFNKTERLTSLQEGVEKDIKRIREKKTNKLKVLEEKENKIEEAFEKKIDNTDISNRKVKRINKKRDKKVYKVNKRSNKLEKRYTRKEKKILKKGEKIEEKIQKIQEEVNKN